MWDGHSVLAELVFFPLSTFFLCFVFIPLSVVGDLHCNLDVRGRLFVVVGRTIDVNELKCEGESDPKLFYLYF